MRRKLVSDIKEYFKKHIDDETMDVDDVLNVNKDICGIIKSQPNVAVTDTNVGCKWIPCSERLPEDSRNVILTTRSSVVGVGSVITRDGHWVQWYFGGGISVDVIAWMPLPEPYREEEQ